MKEKILLWFVFSALLFVGCDKKKKVNYLPAENENYIGKNIEFRLSCGDILAGTLTFPKEYDGKLPAVILITGSSAHDRDNSKPNRPHNPYRPFRQIADQLSSNGIAVLRLDDRGTGASKGGNIVKMNTEERMDDIRQAVDYLRGREEIDTVRVGLLGLSEGASITHMIASVDPSIKCIISLCGAGSVGREIMQYQEKNGLTTGMDLNDLATNNRWYRFFDSFDPLKTARLVQIPTLIIHGETDRRIPVSDAYKLAEAIKENGNSNVSLKTLPKYNHLLLKETPDGRDTKYGKLSSFEIPEEILEMMTDWLSENI